MKIEVGKKYKTRNGKTVFIHSVTRKNANSIVGEFLQSSSFCVWRPDGCFEAGSRDWDLVSEVKEKLKVTFVMETPEDFKGLTADEIETNLREIFTEENGRMKICRPVGYGKYGLGSFVCDDIIFSGITEE